MENYIQATRRTVLKQIQLNTTAKSKLAGLSLKELEPLVFMRKHLRLTFVGHKVLQKILTSYEYTHDNNLKAKHIMALSNLKHPYYISRKYFVLYGEDDALMLSLYGDVQTFLEQSNLFR